MKKWLKILLITIITLLVIFTIANSIVTKLNSKHCNDNYSVGGDRWYENCGSDKRCKFGSSCPVCDDMFCTGKNLIEYLKPYKARIYD